MATWWRGLFALAMGGVIACTTVPGLALGASPPGGRDAAARTRLMRQIRTLGGRIQGDLRRALVEYRSLPQALDGESRGGARARLDSAARVRTDSLAARRDLLDAQRALQAVDADSASLRRDGATVRGLSAETAALARDLANLQTLGGMVGQSRQSAAAARRFARLLEGDKSALASGKATSAPTLRGMLSAITVASRYARDLAQAANPFVRVLEAFVTLGRQGIGRLSSGRLLPWQAIVLEAHAMGLESSLARALPLFQDQVAVRLSSVDRVAMAVAARLTVGGLRLPGAGGGLSSPRSGRRAVLISRRPAA